MSDPHTTKLDDLPALLSVRTTAALLGISRASAYRYAAAGQLPTRRLGRRMYIVNAKLRPLIEGSDEEEAA